MLRPVLTHRFGRFSEPRLDDEFSCFYSGDTMMPMLLTQTDYRGEGGTGEN